jgi:hypothetical protein
MRKHGIRTLWIFHRGSGETRQTLEELAFLKWRLEEGDAVYLTVGVGFTPVRHFIESRRRG